MSIQVSDPILAGQLIRAGNIMELLGPDGQYLGEFTPAKLKPPVINISEEELRRREDPTTGTWFSASDVEAKLRDLRNA